MNLQESPEAQTQKTAPSWVHVSLHQCHHRLDEDESLSRAGGVHGSVASGFVALSFRAGIVELMGFRLRV